MSRNSITPWRAFLAFSLSVWMTMPSATGMAQEAIGFGAFSCSTRHMRQLPAIARRSWKQKCGTSTPASWHACSTVVPGGTSTWTPLTVSFGISSSRRPPRRGLAVLPDPPLHLRPEMADQALHRPSGGVAQSADGVSLDLEGDVEQHVDLGDFRLTLHHPLHHAPHPAGAFATRRALAAAFVLVELRERRDRFDDIGRLVHDDDRRRAEAALHLAQRVEIHEHGVAPTSE